MLQAVRSPNSESGTTGSWEISRAVIWRVLTISPAILDLALLLTLDSIDTYFFCTSNPSSLSLMSCVSWPSECCPYFFLLQRFLYSFSTNETTCYLGRYKNNPLRNKQLHLKHNYEQVYNKCLHVDCFSCCNFIQFYDFFFSLFFKFLTVKLCTFSLFKLN